MKRKLEKWFYGLVGGCIGGGASAGCAWLGLAGAHSAGVDVPVLNLKGLGVVFLTGVVTHGLMYLKQSPLPPPDDTTQFVKKES